MNKITRDDTEHGVEYVRADEAEAEIESIQDGADADKVIIQYHEATIKRLQAEIDMLNRALNAWHEKTDWMQETAQPLELGMHRADVLKQRIDNLNKAEQQAPDYAWPTIEDYEKEVGFEVNDAFKAAWTMARTTNDLFKQMGEIK
jgi:flagellar hook-basal body complex protein FliE